MPTARWFLLLVLFAALAVLGLLLSSADQATPVTEKEGPAPPSIRRSRLDPENGASATPRPMVEAAARVATELPAVTSRVTVRGRVVRGTDGRPVVGCKVLLFLYQIPETCERVSADEIRSLSTWTDPGGGFELSHVAEPESEWRGAVHAYYPGFRRAVFPIVRIEPNRDTDIGQLELIEPPAEELRSRRSMLRGMLEVMELLQR